MAGAPLTRLTDAEWVVMNAVWKRYPTTAREVHEQVHSETEWAYTTVKTLLTRLVEKEILSARKRANTSVYEPLVSQQQARQGALRTVLSNAFGGTWSSLMQHLVRDERLSVTEREELSKLLQDLQQDEEPS